MRLFRKFMQKQESRTQVNSSPFPFIAHSPLNSYTVLGIDMRQGTAEPLQRIPRWVGKTPLGFPCRIQLQRLNRRRNGFPGNRGRLFGRRYFLKMRETAKETLYEMQQQMIAVSNDPKLRGGALER